jgi:putative transposase
MARAARIVVPRAAHHVTQRGNNQQDIFFVDDDRRVYLDLLKEQTQKHAVKVLGYCLMMNHVHLVVEPAREESLALAVGRTHFFYTQYVNRVHRRSGHLWQNRFYSCALDDAHLRTVLRYIENNPVRAGMVRRAWEYRWSSAAEHVGRSAGTGLLDLNAWRVLLGKDDWGTLLRQALEAGEVRMLRLSTHTGRPLGSDRFVSKLERAVGRRLRPLAVGRPKRAKGRNRPK